MSHDDQTIRVYGSEAARYADVTKDAGKDPVLRLFLDHLAPGSSILDLGCGPGIASGIMAAEGHAVTATDATPEMVALAEAQPGVTARLAKFDDIDEVAAYDAIWANFSLLHAPRADLPRHLAALVTALRPGGLFHIGMKTGTGEHRDTLGRLYTYVTETELAGLLRAAGLHPVETRTGADTGLDGSVAEWVTILARKRADD
ncbi:Malonyl-[acyl-carrier protein] O-methyltransferase [Roseovarius sp. THAF8]|uniref:class I SAM-dependent DNA methyltransferase n=1 Tax=Roseovarius sp. THAF8 TaxID=2587846 RepID=UPI001268C29C|nr:class I SAM-dependent methyltransferase [Roseovarius sp. THAF8]QFT98495.1 Malonyl-[acyl-carrier protein] O-methyltransferase [Roseovarius sp. THAF8]